MPDDKERKTEAEREEELIEHLQGMGFKVIKIDLTVPPPDITDVLTDVVVDMSMRAVAELSDNHEQRVKEFRTAIGDRAAADFLVRVASHYVMGYMTKIQRQEIIPDVQEFKNSMEEFLILQMIKREKAH